MGWTVSYYRRASAAPISLLLLLRLPCWLRPVLRPLKSARLYASLLEPTSTAEGFRCHFAPGARERLEGLGLSSPRRVLGADLGELVRESPGRRTWRFRDPRDGVELFLKQYEAGSGRSGKISRLLAPARIEAQRLLELGRAGLPVPELLFACWGRGPGATMQRAVPGIGLDELMRGAARRECESAFSSHVAPLLTAMHAAGFFHRDFYSGHLLARGLGEELSLIDVARVRRWPGPGQRLRVKDLAAALASFYEHVGPTCFLRAFASYCEGVELPLRWRGAAGKRRLARAVVRKARRIRRHRPLRDEPGFDAEF